MSSVLTTVQKTQIVVSAHSDDEEPDPERRQTKGQPSSPLNTTSTSAARGSELSPLSHKYPHTRSCLLGIIREYRLDSDADNDETESLLHQFVTFLKDDNPEELRNTLKASIELSEDAADQCILDLMHAHRDDLNQAPLTVLHAAKRPISRPSSRASTHSFRLNRPESPLGTYGVSTGSAPSSPKPIQLAFRRPHTPVTSPLVSNLHSNATSYITAQGVTASPTSSPTLPHAAVLNLAAASPSSSPLSSPRFLNAKEFKPVRQMSLGSTPSTPSQDVWSSNVPPSSLTRTSSNLAVAPPLVLTPRSATPVSAAVAIPSRPGSSLAAPSRPPFDDEDDDEFSPFSKPKPILYKGSAGQAHPSSEGTGGTSEKSASSPSNSYSRPMSNDDEHYSSGLSNDNHRIYAYNPEDGDDSAWLRREYRPFRPSDRQYDRDQERKMEKDAVDPSIPEGMTPLDVLVSVFGSTMAPAELEHLLAQHSWNFEDTMQFLIERGPNARPHTPNGGEFPNGRSGNYEERPSTFVGRQVHGKGNFPYGPGPPVRQMSRPGRVCRYFLAGECLRADCRFSHDLDRALCRFWLRNACAKGENCEFMHRLPPNMVSPGPSQPHQPPFVVNPNANGRMRFDRSPSRFDDDGDRLRASQEEEFPALGTTPEERDREKFGDRSTMSRQGSYNDPSRSRFATAVKKPTQSGPAPLIVTGAKFAVTPSADDSLVDSPVSASVITPRPSPRFKLHPSTLLPTLPTGDSLNKLYMTYRERPLQLQAARNACLARAADAWRRNDGAGAKRFSRDANDLNVKMAGEAREAAGRLVKERTRLLVQEVVAKRPGGGAGRLIGSGLGVVLGVASGDGAAKVESDEMRTEVAIDLHGLHAAEGVDYLEEFILSLETERFLGLTYVIVGEEKHTGTQDPSRGASKLRLAPAIKEWLHRWGYPWNEWNGVICVDCLTHY